MSDITGAAHLEADVGVDAGIDVGRPARWVKTDTSVDGRIPLCVRVGVTGHRELHDVDRLTKAVDIALDDILDRVPFKGDAHTPLILTVVSSLADGADRLVAARVLHREGRLEVVLPMADDDYEATFLNVPSSVPEFRHFLDQAHLTLTLPGPTDEHGALDRDQGFLAAGSRVAQESDVVIAIWDGKKSHGPGGTGDAVRIVNAQGVPLVHLPTDGTHRIVENLGPDDGSGFGALRPGALEDLQEYNAGKLSAERCTNSLDDARASLGKRPADGDTLPLDQFIDWCAPYFTRADMLANKFQRLHLRTARVIWAFAAAAPLCIAVHAIWHPRNPVAQALILAEIVLLSSIVLLYLWAKHRRYNEQWINSRVLGERLRATYYLALSSASDPGTDERPRLLLEDPVDSWIRRAIDEVWTRRPSWTPKPGDIGPLQRYLASSWISDQATYHERTSHRYQRYHRNVIVLAGFLFSLGVVAAFSHLFLHRVAPEQIATFVSLAAPVCGAAISGYGSQRDYLRHSLRYGRMATLLSERRKAMLEAKDLATTRNVAADVDRLVREDNGNWFGVVRLHDIELPT